WGVFTMKNPRNISSLVMPGTKPRIPPSKKRAPQTTAKILIAEQCLAGDGVVEFIMGVVAFGFSGKLFFGLWLSCENFVFAVGQIFRDFPEAFGYIAVHGLRWKFCAPRMAGL